MNCNPTIQVSRSSGHNRSNREERFLTSESASEVRVCSMLRLLIVAVFVACARAGGTFTVNGGGGGGLPPEIKAAGLTMIMCRYDNTDCPGDDLHKKFAPAASECAKRCRRRADCLQAVYDTDKTCHLRANRCDSGSRTSGKGMYLHRLKAEEGDCPAENLDYFSTIKAYSKSFCVVKGKSCSGQGMYKKPQKIAKFQDCMKKCAGINECAMVDFKDGLCTLEAKACTDDELTATAGSYNYLRLEKDVTSCPGGRQAPGDTLDAVVDAPVKEEAAEAKDVPFCANGDIKYGKEIETGVEQPKSTYELMFGIDLGDDRPSTAYCKNDPVLQCRCKLPKGGYCDGTYVNRWGTICYAGSAEKGMPVTAEACCAKEKLHTKIRQNPTALGNPKKKDEYKEAYSVNCDTDVGETLVSCNLHTYWPTEYKDFLQPEISGNTCSAPAGCKRCGVQAICDLGPDYVYDYDY